MLARGGCTCPFLASVSWNKLLCLALVEFALKGFKPVILHFFVVIPFFIKYNKWQVSFLLTDLYQNK